MLQRAYHTIHSSRPANPRTSRHSRRGGLRIFRKSDVQRRTIYAQLRLSELPVLFLRGGIEPRRGEGNKTEGFLGFLAVARRLWVRMSIRRQHGRRRWEPIRRWQELNGSLTSPEFRTSDGLFLSRLPISKTKPALCPGFFGNDPRRPAGRQPNRVLVRYPAGVIAAFSCPLITRSQETAIHRCRQDVGRHREGVDRCFSAPQVVFGRHQRTDQALRGVCIE